MSYSFPKTVRVRTRRQYQQFGRNSSRRIGNQIIIEFRQSSPVSNPANTKLGITVSKHYGNAVKRNRFKRVVREAFRLCRLQLPKGLDLNVKPRNGITELETPNVLAELLRLMAV